MIVGKPKTGETVDLSFYDTGGFYDEMFASPGSRRPGSAPITGELERLRPEELRRRQSVAERDLRQKGITFNVYGADGGTECIFPFDVVPRIVQSSDFSVIERGLRQRILAVNAFVGDVYGERRIVKAGLVPEALVLSAKGYLPQCQGVVPPRGIYCHVVGTDLVRDRDGQVSAAAGTGGERGALSGEFARFVRHRRRTTWISSADRCGSPRATGYRRRCARVGALS